MLKIKIIYEDNDVLVVDKPAGIVVFSEGNGARLFHSSEKAASTLIDCLIEKYPKLVEAGPPPRYGVVHRLDKNTSGILLAAKTSESLIFLQNQFINRKVEKKYICLVEGDVKSDIGEIKTLIGRSPGDKKKQKVYSPVNAPKSTREAITEYKILNKYKNYTLLEVKIKTGRKHQIRCHLSYIRHPIAGDKMYGFKNSPIPEGLARQFLHAGYLKIKMPNGETKEFKSELPEELNIILKNLSLR